MALRVLPTTYAGKRFRSRLEAKWAFFFDQLGILWEYEPDGFQLNDGTRYLPDFYLPKFSRGIYAEIKPSADPFLKARKFAPELPRPIWLCEGEPRWRTWTVLERAEALDEEGARWVDVWEDQRIPLVDHARMEHRMFYQAETVYGRNEEEWTASEQESRRWEREYFAALDAVRIHRFWEPEVRP